MEHKLTVLLMAQFGVKCSTYLVFMGCKNWREELEQLHGNHYGSKECSNMNILVANSSQERLQCMRYPHSRLSFYAEGRRRGPDQYTLSVHA